MQLETEIMVEQVKAYLFVWAGEMAVSNVLAAKSDDLRSVP